MAKTEDEFKSLQKLEDSTVIIHVTSFISIGEIAQNFSRN